ncbi:transglycosylase family protein [Kitasatospora sp. NBC_01539]|uniref:transglycosylase family protein n=1 Tax=Kitasatospora sp. NBC_01539 TaxID=2903577 RepID=UPI0038600B1E
MFAPLILLPGVLVSGVPVLGVPVLGWSASSVRVSAPAAAAADADLPTPDAVWDALADCESGGDWQADTGNGYYGGLQIWPPTWAEAGGLQYAVRPDLAARREQITVAEEILRRQGWQAWASCARQIGLLPRTGPGRDPDPGPGPGRDPDPGPGSGPGPGPGPGRGVAQPQTSSPFATFVPSSTATGRPASG